MTAFSLETQTLRAYTDLDRDQYGGSTLRREQPTWWLEARCNDGSGTLTGLFFSDQLDEITRARAICSKCVVRTPCLEGALARKEPWGVWGGEFIVKGKITVKRKRGRPPKHPRPEPDLAALDPFGADPFAGLEFDEAQTA